MGNIWVVRSGRSIGEEDNIFDRVEELSCVGIGWPGVGDLSGLNAGQIRQRVAESYPGTPQGVGSDAGNLDRFVQPDTAQRRCVDVLPCSPWTTLALRHHRGRIRVRP